MKRSARAPFPREATALWRLLASILVLSALLVAAAPVIQAGPARLAAPLPAALLPLVPIVVLGFSLRPRHGLGAELAFLSLVPAAAGVWSGATVVASGLAAIPFREDEAPAGFGDRVFRGLFAAGRAALAAACGFTTARLLPLPTPDGPLSLAAPIAVFVAVFVAVEAVVDLIGGWVLPSGSTPLTAAARAGRLLLDASAIPVAWALSLICAHLEPTGAVGVLSLLALPCLASALLIRGLSRSRLRLAARERSLRVRRHEARALRASAKRLQTAASADAALAVVAEEAARASSADWRLTAYTEGGEAPRIEVTGFNGEAVPLASGWRRAISAALAAVAEPVLTGERADAARLGLAPLADTVGAASLMIAPVRTARGLEAGWVGLLSRRPGAWDPPALDLLGALCDQATLALDTAASAAAAAHDPLTGLLRRDGFFERLEEEIQRARRYETPVSVLMLDIDGFKALNDRHGHPAGDEVLRRVGDRIRESLRTVDRPARYGGEEFCILLPECDPEGAHAIAERVRRRVAEIEIPHDGAMLRTSVSIGLAALVPADGTDGASLVGRADRALYEAKRAGGNQVRVAA